jgi:plastocyanin
VQVYANLPLPLTAALDVEPGETVTWKVLDRAHLLLMRLPERKKLKGQAVPQSRTAGWCCTRWGDAAEEVDRGGTASRVLAEWRD